MSKYAEVSFSDQNQGGAQHQKWTQYRCPHGPNLFRSGYISLRKSIPATATACYFDIQAPELESKLWFLPLSMTSIELISRIGRRVVVRIFQRCLVAAGYCSGHPHWCPRLTPDHRHRRRMLAHRHQNWNLWRWSHVILFGVSSVSFYNCNGLARDFGRVVVSNKEDDRNGRGWPWTHQQISHGTSTYGSCSVACMGLLPDK